MKKLVSLTFLLCLSLNLSAQNSALNSEIASLIIPLQSYLSGHIKGDKKMLGQALHSEGKLSYLNAGQFHQLEFADYLSRMKLRDNKDGAQRIPYIKSIDQAANMAIAKLVLDYSSRIFTDYMTLLKINGEWKIVNKIAYSLGDPNNRKPINPDLTLLLATLERYSTAYKAVDLQGLKKVFHQNAKFMSVSTGKYSSQSLKAFVADVSALVSKGGVFTSTEIQNVDATGNVAIGKVQLTSANTTHIHYLAMLNIAGDWKIVNDTWYIAN